MKLIQLIALLNYINAAKRVFGESNVEVVPFSGICKPPERDNGFSKKLIVYGSGYSSKRTSVKPDPTEAIASDKWLFQDRKYYKATNLAVNGKHVSIIKHTKHTLSEYMPVLKDVYGFIEIDDIDQEIRLLGDFCVAGIMIPLVPAEMTIRNTASYFHLKITPSLLREKGIYHHYIGDIGGCASFKQEIKIKTTCLMDLYDNKSGQLAENTSDYSDCIEAGSSTQLSNNLTYAKPGNSLETLKNCLNNEVPQRKEEFLELAGTVALELAGLSSLTKLYKFVYRNVRERM